MLVKRRKIRPALRHQLEALQYAQDKSCIALFMEMRLGKSLVAVRWVKEKIARSDFRPECVYGRTHRVLIVGPLSVLPDWESELRKELVPPSEIHWLLGSKKARLQASNPFTLDTGWFLCNYEGLRSCPELLDHCWFAVIADESTRIRNPKAQTTKLCIQGFQPVKHRAILSGLPAPESSENYFEQFRFLHGSFMGQTNFWSWRQRFFHQGFSEWDWIPNKGTTEAIKKEIHSLAFIRTRKQCGMGSRKVYERRFVEMEPEQKKLYKQVLTDFAYEYQGLQDTTKWAPVKFTWLAQIAGGHLPREIDEEGNEVRAEKLISDSKMKELLTLLKGELKNERVIVWFRFNSELRRARKLLMDAGISAASITGEDPLDKRKAISRRFQALTDVQALLVQVKCGKFGHDWSMASTAIYFSNSYDMEDRLQSEDRIIHPTKSSPVLLIDLITKGTVDEDVVELLREKKTNSKIFTMQLMSRTLEKLKGGLHAH